MVSLSACKQSDLNTKVSNTTGWNYFDQKTTNFEAYDHLGNVNPTGMVPIQGGVFTIGEQDEFITAPRNNLDRQLTVSSFYMDKYEVTCLNWNEYLHWLEIVFGKTAPEPCRSKLVPTPLYGVMSWLTTSPIWRTTSSTLLSPTTPS